MNNKRGDIPVTILVLGVLMICGLALLSFYNANLKTRDSFVGIKLLKEINSQVEQALFAQENPAGLDLEEKVTKGFWFWKKEKILFSVEFEP